MSNARELADVVSTSPSTDINIDNGTLVVDISTDRVGIGTASPDTKLNIVQSSTGRSWSPTGGQGDLIVERNGNAGISIVGANGSTSNLNFGDTDDENAGFITYDHNDNSMSFRTNGSGTDLIIDSGGRLIIGDSVSRTYNDSIQPSIQTNSTAAVYIGAARWSAASPTAAAGITLGRSRGASVGTNGVLNSGDTISNIFFAGDDGTTFLRAASIIGQVDGTPGTNDMPGRLVFSTTADGASSPTERLRIDSSGYVGIGTTAPDVKLHVYSATDHVTHYIESAASGGNAGINVRPVDTGSAFMELGVGRTGNGYAIIDFVGDATYADYGLRIIRNNTGPNTHSQILHRGTSFFELQTSEASDIIFSTSSTERLRIDSSGNIGIGTSAPDEQLHLYGTEAVIKLEDSALTGEGYIDFDGSSLQLNCHRNPNTGANSNNKAPVAIRLSGNDADGSIAFSTKASNSGAATTRMLIDKDGNVGIGTTAPVVPLHLQANNTVLGRFEQLNSSDVRGIVMKHGRGLSGYEGKMVQFQRADSVEVGKIMIGASTTTYSTTSDYRLKENITPLTGAIDRLNQLKPSRFNFIVDPERTLDGFLAHEVSNHVPEAISGEKDAVDENGDIDPQGIDQSKLVPLLVASVQELSAKVTALENA